MKIQTLVLVIGSTLLLSSCADPYARHGDEAQMMIEKDISFLEGYKDSVCKIGEMYEEGLISRGRCLSLYYESKDNERVQDYKGEVLDRVAYIAEKPEKYDKKFTDRLTAVTAETVACTNYINENCL